MRSKDRGRLGNGVLAVHADTHRHTCTHIHSESVNKKYDSMTITGLRMNNIKK